MEPESTAETKVSLGRGRVVFMVALLVAGVVLLGWAAVRALTPPRPPASPSVAAEARAYLREHDVQPLSEPLEKILADASKPLVNTQDHPFLGKPAPDFDLLDTGNEQRRLSQLVAKGPVILVFYYGYNCNHCVSQLFALNADVERIHELGAEVVAISADPVEETRQRFKRYGPFAFPVLSDPGHKVAAAYGTYAPPHGKEEESLLHGTFVIGRDGRIVWAQYGDTPFTGNRTLLVELARSENRLPESANP